MLNWSQQIVDPIRFELKARGLTIKRFAKMLDVSEPTMKRWLKAQGLLLEDWAKMLRVLDLDAVEALARANMKPKGQFEYSEKQEDAFVKHPGLLAFFQQALEGLDAQQIKAKFKLTNASISFYLKKLDDLQLIRWGTGHHFSLVRTGEPKWRKQGSLSKTFRNQVFNELVFDNKNSEKLRLAIYRLSLPEVQKLQEMLNEVFDFAKQAEHRSKYSNENFKTIGLGIVNADYQPDFLYTIPNK